MSAIEETGFPSPRGKVADWGGDSWRTTNVLEKGGKKDAGYDGEDADYHAVMWERGRRGGLRMAGMGEMRAGRDRTPLEMRQRLAMERFTGAAGRTFTAGLGVTAKEQTNSALDRALDTFLEEEGRVSGVERQAKGEKDSGVGK